MNYRGVTFSGNSVPSRFYLVYSSHIIGFLIFSTICPAEEFVQQPVSSHQPYLFPTKGSLSSFDLENLDESVSTRTPPLGRVAIRRDESRSRYENNELFPDEQNNNDKTNEILAPSKVLEDHAYYEQDSRLNSPVYNYIAGNNSVASARDGPAPLAMSSDGGNLNDLVESGSGAGDLSGEDSSGSQHSPAYGFPTTSTMSQSNSGDMDRNYLNEPPMLTRRIPKLVAEAGRYWRYSIPYDTFFDEDGDLRQLNSNVIFKGQFRDDDGIDRVQSKSLNLSLAGKNINQFFNWLHYDQSKQMLYGFPTEDDAGWHEYLLVVDDLSGLVNYEKIEIHVRQHPSTRAFTHQFGINDINFEITRYQSFIEVLKDFVARLSLSLSEDSNAANIIVHSHGMQPITGLDESASSKSEKFREPYSNLTIVWSNSSLPVHICDYKSLNEISEKLTGVPYSNLIQSVDSQKGYSSAPSQNLLKALEPYFRPSSVSISLLAACQDQTRALQNGPIDNEADLKLQMKIGKLDWKLGVPIAFRVPEDTFIAGSRNTRNFSLTLHTIDGLPLAESPRYSFLEFDQDNQIMFGLPYDMDLHVGQKELLLTARNPKRNQFVREVFIFNAEPQDLTTINNRAFRMSLYFLTRNNLFGPKNRVALSAKIVQAMQAEHSEFNRLQTMSEFTVIDVKKFLTTGYPSNSFLSSYSANVLQFKGLLGVNDIQTNKPDDNQRRMGLESDATPVYKFTWTNESIGYRGDCPVEVIKENILYALERSMIDFNPPLSDNRLEDQAKNDSVKFYERLRSYFEPELDLIHLRFEPSSACTNALELHDVGNSEIADEIDGVGDYSQSELESTTTGPVRSSDLREESPINSEEYWSIIVLIVLVAALIFVIMMFFMGMHTYKINQEKKFELQVKLAQARQNSMFLSSMVLADQAHPNDIVSQMGMAKPLYIVQDEDGSSRKPVILDNEKQLLANNQFAQFHMHGQFMGQPAMYPLRPNMTFTLDSIASSVQNSMNSTTNFGPATNNRRRAMTLNRRVNNSQPRLPRNSSITQLNHSQSILTVASLATPMHMIPHPMASYPVVYTPLPPVCESNSEMPREV